MRRGYSQDLRNSNKHVKGQVEESASVLETEKEPNDE